MWVSLQTILDKCKILILALKFLVTGCLLCTYPTSYTYLVFTQYFNSYCIYYVAGIVPSYGNSKIYLKWSPQFKWLNIKLLFNLGCYHQCLSEKAKSKSYSSKVQWYQVCTWSSCSVGCGWCSPYSEKFHKQWAQKIISPGELLEEGSLPR